jgi:hypothetical protein
LQNIGYREGDARFATDGVTGKMLREERTKKTIWQGKNLVEGKSPLPLPSASSNAWNASDAARRPECTRNGFVCKLSRRMNSAAQAKLPENRSSLASKLFEAIAASLNQKL